MSSVESSGTVRRVALFLTLLTGFTGLVYEVTWQKYLAALLGSDSEATATVLGIFLGGLAVGYALFGRVARRRIQRSCSGGSPARLLLLYGVIEAGIGVYALCFPLLFLGIQKLSLWIPHGSPGLAFGIDAGLCTLLVGPPSVLMGGTIPLLTQSLARSLEDSTRLHAFVYGFNTAGAFAGALCASFFLIPWLGLGGVMLTMALVNLGAGGIFGFLGSALGPESESPPESASEPAPAGALHLRHPLTVCASVALLSGFAMMTIQTILNRVGALALGASQFTFSMIVACFVLCIALGSFAVSALRRIPPALLPVSQWLLVAILLALYPVIEDAPYWGHLLRSSFSNQDANFFPFHLAVFGAILGVFLVPLALSGATLPLLFHQLRREAGQLGSAAGSLYSWNTLGSLLGALLGGYALLFWLDLHQVYWLAMMALAIGAVLLCARVSPRGRTVGLVGLCLALLAVGLQPAWSPYKLSAGLFRHREPLPYSREGAETFFAEYRKLRSGDYIAYYNDDPSTSVAVFRYPDSSGVPVTAIINNGKSDGNVPGDYLTMSMASLLPALLTPKPERAFVVGYGTGVSVAELTSLPSIREVHVAEISTGVMEAAQYFESYERAAASPKTRIIVGDAYRALLRSEGHYDVIVSEPSNPWVTGVEMLFSLEFLEAARARLSPEGVYLQWFHTYETDSRTVGVVLRTFSQVFEQVGVWYSQRGDLMILGFGAADVRIDLDELEKRWSNGFAAAFHRVQIDSLPELLAHELLPLSVVHAADLPDEVHTIAHPILSHRAARAFFAPEGRALLPVGLTAEVRATGASNSLLRRYRERWGGSLPDAARLSILGETCAHRAGLCATLFAEWQHEDPDSPTLAQALATARGLRVGSSLTPRVLELLGHFFADADSTVPATDLDLVDVRRVYERAYHHAAPFTRSP